MKNVNISETVTDRAIFDPRGTSRVLCCNTKNLNFYNFLRPSWISAEIKNRNIPETVRDRAISIEFFKEYFVATQKKKNQFFSNFGGHIGFYQKTKNVNIAETCGLPVSSRPWLIFFNKSDIL